nr:hypothetical protein BN993_05276 [Virgibacillus halodenitrificans]
MINSHLGEFYLKYLYNLVVHFIYDIIKMDLITLALHGKGFRL